MVLVFSLGVSSKVQIQRAFVLVSCLTASSHLMAERYIVTDDVFGNAAAKQYTEQEAKAILEADAELNEPTSVEDSPKEDRTVEGASVKDSTEQTSETATDNAADVAALDGTLSNKAVENPPLDNSADATTRSAEGSNSDPRTQLEQQAEPKENPFERALRLSEENETDEVIRRLRAQGGDTSFDATKVNPADFVDSEDLLQGNVNSDGERPFYVTIDSQGESNVIFYSPKVIEDEINRREAEELISDAVVYSADDTMSELNLPEGADPVAARILSSGVAESYFTRFSGQCCGGLPNVGVRTLRTDKALHVPLQREDFSYRFVDGDSRYQLVKLPDFGRDYRVTVKSFVRSYKDEGIKHGAFIPQLVMLDRNKNVRRIISELDSESHAETWSSYGYLKSVIEVQQQQIDAEALILVYTRARDLRRVTTIEDSSGRWEIKHMEVGSLEFEIAASDKY